ncbi:MAG TPA: hypothetical protein VNJ07_03755 [Chitinophagales bacterium]|nr:hypothetical protein [Chitinophagales bacterium]
MFILSGCLFAQTDSILYFNHYWKETTRDSAAYYRLTEKKGNNFWVRDYYISGKLQMEGKYLSLKPEIQDGYFVWYYENGQKFAEGKYVHGRRDGVWIFWFPDGLKKEEIKFFPGRRSEYVIKWQSKRMKGSKPLVERAMNQKKKGNTDQAFYLLNSALQVNPFSAEALFERGLLNCKKGEKEFGCSDLLKAREYGYYDTFVVNKAIEENCLK